MTVALLVRDSAVARLLAHRVAQSYDLRLVVVESGRVARRAKLRRELRRGFPWRLPLTILDLAAVAVYQGLWSAYASRRNRKKFVPLGWPATEIMRVDDVNDPWAVRLLMLMKPDVCLVLGTAILRGETLRVAGRYLLNIHGGIVPAYRNVHSEFWAVMRNDLDNIGVTVMHLGAGVDSGAIVLQRRLTVNPSEPLFSIRYRNAGLTLEAGMEALAAAVRGPLPREPQSHEAAGFYSTPGVAALLRMCLRRRRAEGNDTTAG